MRSENKSLAEKMDRALSALPVETRLAIHLHFVESIGLAEVSFIMGDSIHQIRKQVNQGLRALSAGFAANGFKTSRSMLITGLKEISKLPTGRPEMMATLKALA